MRTSDLLVRIINEWMRDEDKDSQFLGKISNRFDPFSLDSTTFSSCLWEILRDERIPSAKTDPMLRETIVEALYGSSTSADSAQKLALRGGGVEWEAEEIEDMLPESALFRPKQNIDEVEYGLKNLILGSTIPSDKSKSPQTGIEILIPQLPPKKPRDYQVEVISQAMSKIGKDGRCNIVLPTGAGKTYCAVEIIVSLLCNGRVEEVFWCTNRTDLLSQASSEIRKRWSIWDEGTRLPELTAVQNGTATPEAFSPPIILFRTLQGEHKRHREANDRRLLVVDESHRHLDQSEILVRENLSSGGLVMGLTGTINDEWQRIGDIFGSNVVPSSVSFSPGHKLDSSNFEEVGILASKIEHSGSPGGNSLSEVGKEESLDLMLEIVLGRIEELGIRKSLVFVEGVDTAKLLAGRISGSGVPATHVSGKTHPRVRESVKRSLESGELRVIVNDELWKEGIDIPSIDSVFILRNTVRNSVTAEQMIGRGLRVPEGEETSQTHIIWGY